LISAIPASLHFESMPSLKGAQVVAHSLKQQGIKELFGVIGYPVTEIAFRAQEEGLRYIGTRHEQTAGFAAQAAGYLRRHVGAALTITGPGMTNAVTALGNAWANGWPLLLIAGGSDTRHAYRGGFQEGPQMEAARPFVKWMARPYRIEDIPRLIAQGVRKAWHGRPGPVYLEIPADLISGSVEESSIEWAPAVPPPARPSADPVEIERALELLRRAERPLLIVGKGAAWADAAPELRRLVERTGIPFLPTPMGKGVIPDDHPACAAAARSQALAGADVILAVGTRFNWILHFGIPPRYRPDVKVIQVDIAPDDLGGNVPVALTLGGDAKAIAAQLVAGFEHRPWKLPADHPWVKELRAETANKKDELRPMLEDSKVPMGYYRPLREIQDALPRDAFLISEGANTMDLSRSVLECYEPAHRLDAGTWGTMGVGAGYAIAAAVVNPGKPVLALMGDGAFGFSGMEVEVAVRHKLPIVWVVLNNNGIGAGIAKLPEGAPPPPHVYLPGARYDRIMEAFGAKGVHCETPESLRAALRESLQRRDSSLIHVPIDPAASPATSRYQWLR
jgi:2-hydroxyacyl-CoA lyase 1